MDWTRVIMRVHAWRCLLSNINTTIFGLQKSYILKTNISSLQAGVLFEWLKNIPTPFLVCLVSSDTPQVKEWFNCLRPQNVPWSADIHVLQFHHLSVSSIQQVNIFHFSNLEESIKPVQGESNSSLQPVL
jgi:hypothetical protein